MKRKNDVTFFRNVKAKKTEIINNNLLKKFEPGCFYTVKQDTYIRDNKNNQYIKPYLEASKLIADYYAIKFRCNMDFTRKNSTHHSEAATTPVNLLNSADFLQIRQSKSDYRKAFLSGMDDCHATPIIYLKEGEHEGIFIADSLGNNNKINQLAIDIYKATNIKVYLIKEPRQADTFSCYIDALLFARDSTAFNEENNSYYIINLLSFLMNHSTMKNDFFLVNKLPDELHKTGQLSSFHNQYRNENSTNIIHRNETLTLFRNRYTDLNVPIRLGLKNKNEEPSTDDIYSYPRKKGLKLISIVEIQFYLNQINTALEYTLSKNEKLNFIQQAKIILRDENTSAKKDRLYHYCDEFLNNYKKSPQNEVSFEIFK